MAWPSDNRREPESVVVTGIGLVTPLGTVPAQVLDRVEAGATAFAPPENFDPTPFSCRLCAAVKNFHPQEFIAEAKMIRLMNRDAQFAVAAAHQALQDAEIQPGTYYQPEDIGLFGATGLAGLPFHEIAPLIKASTNPEGNFNLAMFGKTGLRSVNPILSFKILGNMPVCFVSICENIQGPNAVYTPWEGQGARAIEAAILALQSGDARCVLAGGCDVKTHEVAFLALEQNGLFNSWREHGNGLVPGEGAVFLVLETETEARKRGARMHARVEQWNFVTWDGPPTSKAYEYVLGRLDLKEASAVIAAANGVPGADQAEAAALSRVTARLEARPAIHSPKKHAGDLFAGAAALQLALGALACRRYGGKVLANCFGHGSEQAAFVLSPP